MYRLGLENMDPKDLEQLLEELEGKWENEVEPEKLTKLLVMHYTVCDFPCTIRAFTENKLSGNVSAHYVIPEQEEKNQIQGGKIIQVCT